jgi:uncharacterized membrane protein
VPLLFFMVSNHYPTMYGSSCGWLCAMGTVVVGFLVTMYLYRQSGAPSTTKV